MVWFLVFFGKEEEWGEGEGEGEIDWGNLCLGVNVDIKILVPSVKSILCHLQGTKMKYVYLLVTWGGLMPSFEGVMCLLFSDA